MTVKEMERELAFIEEIDGLNFDWEDIQEDIVMEVHEDYITFGSAA